MRDALANKELKELMIWLHFNHKDYLIGIMKRTNYRQIRFAQKILKSHGNVQNVDINGKQL